jgi:carbon storage regulator
MLVLTRYPDQKIILGDGKIEILVVNVSGNRVRLGIKAPLGLSIHREEVYKAIKDDEQTLKS